jgi:hypothetical protein
MTPEPTPPDLDPHGGAHARTIGANRVPKSVDRDASTGGLATGRIQSLSDGILSVAMTLMFLTLIVPASAHLHTDHDLVGRLGSLAPGLAVDATVPILVSRPSHLDEHFRQSPDRSHERGPWLGAKKT